ncbi:solute carrier family 35 member F6 [Epargyreus clarus]|uniref:solute carrier family 35 member F6 n=1 Tax=Epargyreus clarus TaxID=520877 RepID=UPI003C2BB00B
MAWTGYQKFLALVMVITGSINTLSTKWADKIKSTNSAGEETYFEHPFLQSSAMFLGEILCLLTFKIIYFKTRNSGGHALVQGTQDFNPFILMPAAMFDLIATSIMYIGLTLTYVSSFQMFRGSVIIFVAMLSTTFLEKNIMKREWTGIFFIIVGLLIVGGTDAAYPTGEEAKGKNSLITGDLLIILAQVITACQMVYEEKYVTSLNIAPMQAVGWEGVFGFSVLSVLLFIFYWVPAPPHFGHNPRGVLEDVIDGFVQIGNNSALVVSILGTIISIAFFNFAGISVTKEMSATTRMVLDSVRTLVVWMVSLGVRWQSFHWPHLIGFSILILGMCQYNGIVPVWCPIRRNTQAAADPEQNPVVHADADVTDE